MIAFPNLQYTSVREWMGFRPIPPDSTPLIGEIGSSGTYTGFGHQHIGMTSGPKTGRLIAQLGSAASVETSNIHLETIRALRQINSLFATVAYPILSQSGDLLDSRLTKVRVS